MNGSSFGEFIDGLIEREGGDKLVNDPRDPGGLTKYGISARSFPGVDIAELSLADAKRLYRLHYWNPLRLDDMPQVLAVQLFDHGVNRGLTAPARLLQRLVGAVTDGRIGPKTLAKLGEAITNEGGYDATRAVSLAREFALGRISEYVEIAWDQDRPLSHLVSWTRRALELAPKTSR